MKNLSKELLNYLLFVVAAMVFSGFQSALWLQLFGWFPAPQLWLTILVFWVLYRELWESVLMMYLLAVVVSAFTAKPFAHLLVINLLICLTLVFIKRRVYWSGATFFMLASGAATVALFFSGHLVSWRYDRNPATEFAPLRWLFTILVTMLLSLPLHRILSWFDRWTEKEHPTTAGTGIL
jgi:hypothetical protein